MMVYIVIAGVFSVIGMAVSNRLKSKFKKYSQMGITSGLSGAEVAKKMLYHYNISDVNVVEGKGFLSDHYNPRTKTVALSPHVFNGRTVAAAAIAAHECGHAVQHDTAYAWLQMRSAIVPFVNFASMAQQYLLMIALGFFGMGGGSTILLLTIAAFAVTTAFSFITLPVEFDASKRALVWLDSSGITGPDNEYFGARDALKWAALTYVVAALSSLAILVFLILRYVGSD
jgi:Zn-dependent membrane protease YugP